MIQPQAWFAIPLTQKKVPRVLGWITGDVRKRAWSRALLSLSLRLPAVLQVGDCAAHLSLPASFALKNIQCHLISGLPEGGGQQTSRFLARKKKIKVIIITLILF